MSPLESAQFTAMRLIALNTELRAELLATQIQLAAAHGGKVKGFTHVNTSRDVIRRSVGILRTHYLNEDIPETETPSTGQ